MNFVFSVVFVIIGYAIASVGVSQITTILFFAVPFTHEMSRVTSIDKSRIFIKLTTTLCIWVTIILVVFVLTYTLTYKMGELCVGFLVGGLSVMKYCGRTEANIKEYFVAYSQYIDMRFLEDFAKLGKT